MNSSLYLFIHLTLHILAPIFVHGDVSLLLEVHTGADPDPGIVNLSRVYHNLPQPLKPHDEDFIRYQEPLYSDISTIQKLKEKFKDFKQRCNLHVDRVVKKVIPPRPKVLYKVFFTTSKEVKNKKSFGKSTQKLAKQVSKLFSKGVRQNIQLNLSQKEDILIKIFKNAKESLENRYMPKVERLWIIGMIAGLLKHLPSDASEVRNYLNKDPWKDYLYLEVKTAMAYEAAFTDKFLDQFGKEVKYQYNPAMENCLKRAQILDRQDQQMIKESFQRIPGLEEYVVKEFLALKIPSSKKDIEKTIKTFSNIFKDMDASSLQGEQAISIFLYLKLRHWNTMKTRDIIQFVESDEKLYRNFYSTFARYDLKILLENSQVLLRIKDLNLQELNHQHSPSLKTVQNLIKLFKDNHLTDDVEFEIYKVLMIECTLHPEVNKILIQSIIDDEKLAVQILGMKLKNRVLNSQYTSHEFSNYIMSTYLLHK